MLEQALIDAGAIQALGFRYAGVVRGSRKGDARHELQRQLDTYARGRRG